MPDLTRRVTSFLAELERRRVYRAATVYLVVGLGVLGAAEVVLDPLGLGAARPVLVVLVLGAFPIALVLAWAYDLRPASEVTSAPASEAGRADSAATGPAADGRASVVVLPFANLSPDEADAYFSEGLTDEITTNLAYMRSLRIISRSTAAALKETGKDVRAMSRELGVDYVLEGSVRKSGDRLRVSAQLIDARADEHLWTERHDGTLDDVFAVQERIALHVATALRLRLTPLEERRLGQRPIADPHAYDTWVHAMHEGRRFAAEGIERGISLARQALEIEGDNARLYASLGFLYWAAYDFGVSYESETLDLAEQAASRALELDPTLPLALHARGLVRYKRGDMQGFVRHARAAADLGGNSDAAGMLAFVLGEVGSIEAARRYGDEAVRADPLTFLPWFFRASVDLFDGRPHEAFTRIRDARDRLAVGEAFAGWWVAQMAAYAGLDEIARTECEAVVDSDGGLWTDFCELFRRALEGDREGVRSQIAETQIDRVARTDEYYPIFVANALALVGEHDAALEWIERAVGWGFTNHRFLETHNPFYAPLRGDARFRDLVEAARRKREAFDA